VKLYVIVDSALSPGMAAAQAVHAAFAFALAWPDLTSQWQGSSNNIVVLQEADLGARADALEAEGLRLVRFHEPDLKDALTAICVEPEARRALSSLRLAA